MTRKAELDKPYSLDCARYLLKDFVAAGVVIEQVVVGTEQGGDLALSWKWRSWNTQIFNR